VTVKWPWKRRFYDVRSRIWSLYFPILWSTQFQLLLGHEERNDVSKQAVVWVYFRYFLVCHATLPLRSTDAKPDVASLSAAVPIDNKRHPVSRLLRLTHVLSESYAHSALVPDAPFVLVTKGGTQKVKNSATEVKSWEDRSVTMLFGAIQFWEGPPRLIWLHQNKRPHRSSPVPWPAPRLEANTPHRALRPRRIHPIPCTHNTS